MAAPEPAPKPAAGEIVVTGETAPPPGDPLSRVNAASYEVTQQVDGALVAPAAFAYRDAVPGPVRSGLRNVLNNLNEPVAFLNFLLQLKPGKAMETLVRFGVNSTAGVGGLVDVAKKKPFNLPRRPNGLGNTLGFYGVKPGAYLFLPLVGPTTVRDLVGGAVDRLVLPNAVGTPFDKLYYTVPTGVISSLDRRLEIDEKLTRFRTESADPYGALRDDYLKRRQAAIDELRGKAPAAEPAPPTPSSPVTPAPPAP